MRQAKKNKIQHCNTTKAKEQNKTKFKNWGKSSLKIGKMQTTSIVGYDHGHTSCNTKRNNNTPSKKQGANIVKEKHITTKLIDN
jgi:predicted transcriptional regulator